MLRSARGTSHLAAHPRWWPRASTRRLAPGRRAEHWRTLRHAATGLLILGLAGLGSYDLEASKPRSLDAPVERICPQRFGLSERHAAIQIPLCLNVESLEVANPEIQRAVVVLHGNSRNATSSQVAVESAIGSASESAIRATGGSDILVVAPQFLTALDLEASASPPEVAIWRRSGWSQGHRAVAAPGTERPSSFELLDRLVEAIARPGLYPNLRQITVAGHSAGGQFVQRYAAGTRVESEPTIVARRLTFRYVVANPSSYLYLFPREPDALTDACPRFDEYKYGLVDLNDYLRPVGADGIRAAYARKDVTVLLGRLDHQLLDPSKDDSCEARVQGTHRVNRGIRFARQLDQQYGAGQHGTRLVMVPDAGHSSRAMFTSAEGRAAILGS